MHVAAMCKDLPTFTPHFSLLFKDKKSLTCSVGLFYYICIISFIFFLDSSPSRSNNITKPY